VNVVMSKKLIGINDIPYLKVRFNDQSLVEAVFYDMKDFFSKVKPEIIKKLNKEK
jgi:hypothetical protein